MKKLTMLTVLGMFLLWIATGPGFSKGVPGSGRSGAGPRVPFPGQSAVSPPGQSKISAPDQSTVFRSEQAEGRQPDRATPATPNPKMKKPAIPAMPAQPAKGKAVRKNFRKNFRDKGKSSNKTHKSKRHPKKHHKKRGATPAKPLHPGAIHATPPPAR